MPIRFKLSQAIKKRGWEMLSYRELEEKTGVGFAALYIMMNNKKRNRKAYSPSVEVLEKLCKVLRCQPGDLIEYRKR